MAGVLVREQAAVKHSIAHVALVVRDYDEAIAFCTQKLGFIQYGAQARG